MDLIVYAGDDLKRLKDFGIEVINDNYKQFYIQGGQLYRSREYDIEGDWSGQK